MEEPSACLIHGPIAGSRGVSSFSRHKSRGNCSPLACGLTHTVCPLNMGTVGELGAFGEPGKEPRMQGERSSPLLPVCQRALLNGPEELHKCSPTSQCHESPPQKKLSLNTRWVLFSSSVSSPVNDEDLGLRM
jgi:hypothetical protein